MMANTPLAIATNVFFVRHATTMVTRVAVISGNPFVTTDGVTMETRIAAGTARNPLSSRFDGVSRFINQKPPALVTYVANAIPIMVRRTSGSIFIDKGSYKASCQPAEQDVPFPRQNISRDQRNSRSDDP